MNSDYNNSVIERLKQRSVTVVQDRLTETLTCCYTKQPQPTWVNELRHFIAYNELPSDAVSYDLSDDTMDVLLTVINI